MDVLRMNSYTYSVAIVPCIGSVHENIIAIIGSNGQMVVVALKENEIDLKGLIHRENGGVKMEKRIEVLKAKIEDIQNEWRKKHGII